MFHFLGLNNPSSGDLQWETDLRRCAPQSCIPFLPNFSIFFSCQNPVLRLSERTWQSGYNAADHGLHRHVSKEATPFPKASFPETPHGKFCVLDAIVYNFARMLCIWLLLLQHAVDVSHVGYAYRSWQWKNQTSFASSKLGCDEMTQEWTSPRVALAEAFSLEADCNLFPGSPSYTPRLVVAHPILLQPLRLHPTQSHGLQQ